MHKHLSNLVLLCVALFGLMLNAEELRFDLATLTVRPEFKLKDPAPLDPFSAWTLNRPAVKLTHKAVKLPPITHQYKALAVPDKNGTVLLTYTAVYGEGQAYSYTSVLYDTLTGDWLLFNGGLYYAETWWPATTPYGWPVEVP